VDVRLHSPIRRHGVLRNYAQGHFHTLTFISLCLLIELTKFVFFQSSYVMDNRFALDTLTTRYTPGMYVRVMVL
jgi:hypothetical protein